MQVKNLTEIRQPLKNIRLEVTTIFAKAVSGCVYVCMYLCVSMCVCMCVCVCACMYVCMYVCMYMAIVFALVRRSMFCTCELFPYFPCGDTDTDIHHVIRIYNTQTVCISHTDSSPQRHVNVCTYTRQTDKLTDVSDDIYVLYICICYIYDI